MTRRRQGNAAAAGDLRGSSRRRRGPWLARRTERAGAGRGGGREGGRQKRTAARGRRAPRCGRLLVVVRRCHCHLFPAARRPVAYGRARAGPLPHLSRARDPKFCRGPARGRRAGTRRRLPPRRGDTRSTKARSGNSNCNPRRRLGALGVLRDGQRRERGESAAGRASRGTATSCGADASPSALGTLRGQQQREKEGGREGGREKDPRLGGGSSFARSPPPWGSPPPPPPSRADPSPPPWWSLAGGATEISIVPTENTPFN
jgi:hypothetical protein